MRNSDPWASAVPRWVRLAELPTLVKRKLGIRWADAAGPLREALEGSRIYTDIPDWLHGGGTHDHSLIFSENGRVAVSGTGWKWVDWRAGTLKGYPVLVLWPHVTNCIDESRGRIERRGPGQPDAKRKCVDAPKLVTNALVDVPTQPRLCAGPRRLSAPTEPAAVASESDYAPIPNRPGSGGRKMAAAIEAMVKAVTDGGVDFAHLRHMKQKELPELYPDAKRTLLVQARTTALTQLAAAGHSDK